MIINTNILLSFTAGVLAFLSPCVLPLIPSYITFIGGVTINDLNKSRYKRRSVVFKTIAFVVGFLLVFSIIGLIIFGTFLSLNNQLGFLDIIAGFIVIILGLNFIFNFLKILNIEKRFEFKNRPTSIIGALIVGMAFGAGWTPCIGPLLQGIFLLTASTETTFLGVANLIAFSLGLGLPFIIMSLFFPFVVEKLNKLKKYLPVIRIISGIFLVGIGLLILSGRIQKITFFFAVAANILRVWNQVFPLLVQLAGGLFLLGIAFLILIPFLRRSLKNNSARELQISKVVIGFSMLFTIMGFAHFFGFFNLAEFFAGWLEFSGG
jgi:cytochrome c-type biogenesis protein